MTEKADYIIMMVGMKHPGHNGLNARKGIVF